MGPSGDESWEAIERPAGGKSWREVQADVCRALGLDPNDVYGIEIQMMAGRPPRMVVTMREGYDMGGVDWDSLVVGSRVYVFSNEAPWESGGGG